MKMEEIQIVKNETESKNVTKLEVPSFMDEITSGGRMKIGMVNMEEYNVSEWRRYGEIISVGVEKVSELFKWSDLFPEWIDEEEENDSPSCPEIPMPDFEGYEKMDVVVGKLPCKYPEEGWSREVMRLQMHLIVANLGVKKGKMDWNWRIKVVLWSKCRPMLEIFRCDDLVRNEGDWWYYEPEVARLHHKVSLPVGSCKLALPLWGQGMPLHVN